MSVDTSVTSSTLTAKGSSTINQVNISRNDSICTMPRDVVHQEIHHKYCYPHQTAKDTNQEESIASTLKWEIFTVERNQMITANTYYY